MLQPLRYVTWPAPKTSRLYYYNYTSTISISISILYLYPSIAAIGCCPVGFTYSRYRLIKGFTQRTFVEEPHDVLHTAWSWRRLLGLTVRAAEHVDPVERHDAKLHKLEQPLRAHNKSKKMKRGFDSLLLVSFS